MSNTRKNRPFDRPLDEPARGVNQGLDKQIAEAHEAFAAEYGLDSADSETESGTIPWREVAKEDLAKMEEEPPAVVTQARHIVLAEARIAELEAEMLDWQGEVETLREQRDKDALDLDDATERAEKAEGIVDKIHRLLRLYKENARMGRFFHEVKATVALAPQAAASEWELRAEDMRERAEKAEARAEEWEARALSYAEGLVKAEAAIERVRALAARGAGLGWGFTVAADQIIAALAGPPAVVNDPPAEGDMWLDPGKVSADLEAYGEKMWPQAPAKREPLSAESWADCYRKVFPAKKEPREFWVRIGKNGLTECFGGTTDAFLVREVTDEAE